MTAKLFYRLVSCYDKLWRYRHKVEKIDQLISLSFERFSGQPTAMNDGTWIEPGDHLAILHFNHDCFHGFHSHSGGYARGALRFRKLLMLSFRQLAERVAQEPRFEKIKAFHGVSWLPPHGEKVGFMIDRLPDTMINHLRKLYFRILLKTFFPALASRNKPTHPHAYWLTRNNLLKYFPGESCGDET